MGRYSRAMTTEADPVASYLATLEHLKSRKRWSTSLPTVRYAALALGPGGEGVDLDRLERATDTLREGAGWTSPFRSEVRHVIAAMILREGLDPAGVRDRVLETRAAFRGHGIPRRMPGSAFAALVLAMRAAGGPVPDRQLERLARIYRHWRSAHFWLTGADDLPAAAVHAAGDREVDMLAADVERAYARLVEAGFRRGGALQLVSHLVAADSRGVETGVERFRRIAERMQRSDRKVRAGRYDEVALLALTEEDPATLVERVLEHRERLRAARPRPGKDLAFSLAAGIALAADQAHAAERGAGDLAALHSLQAILNARHAAVAASAGAGAAVGHS